MRRSMSKTQAQTTVSYHFAAHYNCHNVLNDKYQQGRKTPFLVGMQNGKVIVEIV